MSLTVIVPTISRLSLTRALQSILPQLLPGDECLVVGDGEQRNARRTTNLEYEQLKDGVQLLYFEYGPTKDWGNAQRQFGLYRARTTHIAFLDDDDVWAPGARLAIEAGITVTPSVPHIFRMRYANGFTLWQVPALRCGNVGTPMIIVPRNPSKLGKWSSRYEGDFDFISTWGWTDPEICWHHEVIALIEPEDGK
jgi:glycosyltransferase involved in cell wall biosynthesis